MAEARFPASCGELIQGWIDSSEKLISCPINWFSEVSVTEGTPRLRSERPLMREALQYTLDFLNLPRPLGGGLRIDFESSIPIAKGMGSSTADIAATITATALHFGQPVSESELAKICVALEPTDSTIFSQLTLFDHNNGIATKSYTAPADIDVVVLESPLQLTTAQYHRFNRLQALLDSAETMRKAQQRLDRALRMRQPYELGEATTQSAIESQKILRKPGFPELLDLVEKHGLFGLAIAHSGSVVGLLYSGREHDIERAIRDIYRSHLCYFYPTFHRVKMISGADTDLSSFSYG